MVGLTVSRMIRRTNSKAPNFIVVGSIITVLVLAYNYWVLTSKNSDLEKEIEKLQAELKISVLKHEQFEKKNALLQQNMQEMDAKATKLMKQIELEHKKMNEVNRLLKEKESEVKTLKDNTGQQQDEIKALNQQIEEKDLEINSLQQDNAKIESQRDEAYDAIGDKDAKYKELKAELERETALVSEYEAQLASLKEAVAKAKMGISALQREKLSAADPGPVPGMMNLPVSMKNGAYVDKGSLDTVRKNAVQTKDKAMEGFIVHRGIPIIPHQLPNAPRGKPRFSVSQSGADNQTWEHNRNLNSSAVEAPKFEDSLNHPLERFERPKVMSLPEIAPSVVGVIPPPLGQNQILSPKVPLHSRSSSSSLPPRAYLVMPLQPQQNSGPGGQNSIVNREVLDNHSKDGEAHVIPLPPQNLQENLDAAVDEEERVIEDPLDDQDEEGKEIKQDMENRAEENYNHVDYDNVEERGQNVAHLEAPEKNLYPEPRGIGAGGMSRLQLPKEAKQVDDFRGEDPLQGNERIYDGKLKNSLRDLAHI